MPRNNKVIDDEQTYSNMQSPPFRILGISKNHHRQPTLLINKSNKDNNPNCSRLSRSQAIPIGLADIEEREEKKTKPPQAPKRKEDKHSQEDSHTPHCPDVFDETLPARASVNDLNQDALETLQ